MSISQKPNFKRIGPSRLTRSSRLNTNQPFSQNQNSDVQSAFRFKRNTCSLSKPIKLKVSKSQQEKLKKSKISDESLLSSQTDEVITEVSWDPHSPVSTINEVQRNKDINKIYEKLSSKNDVPVNPSSPNLLKILDNSCSLNGDVKINQRATRKRHIKNGKSTNKTVTSDDLFLKLNTLIKQESTQFTTDLNTDTPKRSSSKLKPNAAIMCKNDRVPNMDVIINQSLDRIQPSATSSPLDSVRRSTRLSLKRPSRSRTKRNTSLISDTSSSGELFEQPTPSPVFREKSFSTKSPSTSILNSNINNLHFIEEKSSCVNTPNPRGKSKDKSLNMSGIDLWTDEDDSFLLTLVPPNLNESIICNTQSISPQPKPANFQFKKSYHLRSTPNSGKSPKILSENLKNQITICQVGNKLGHSTTTNTIASASTKVIEDSSKISVINSSDDRKSDDQYSNKSANQSVCHNKPAAQYTKIKTQTFLPNNISKQGNTSSKIIKPGVSIPVSRAVVNVNSVSQLRTSNQHTKPATMETGIPSKSHKNSTTLSVGHTFNPSCLVFSSCRSALDTSLSDDLLVSLAEPDDLFDSQLDSKPIEDKMLKSTHSNIGESSIPHKQETKTNFIHNSSSTSSQSSNVLNSNSTDKISEIKYNKCYNFTRPSVSDKILTDCSSYSSVENKELPKKMCPESLFEEDDEATESQLLLFLNETEGSQNSFTNSQPSSLLTGSNQSTVFPSTDKRNSSKFYRAASFDTSTLRAESQSRTNLSKTVTALQKPVSNLSKFSNQSIFDGSSVTDSVVQCSQLEINLKKMKAIEKRKSRRALFSKNFK